MYGRRIKIYRSVETFMWKVVMTDDTNILIGNKNLSRCEEVVVDLKQALSFNPESGKAAVD